MSELDINYNEIEDLDYCLKLLEKRDKEIERLNEIIKGLREERDYLFNKTTTESNYEIERLNNIIKQISNEIYKKRNINFTFYGCWLNVKNILDKSQELKENK